MRVVEPHVLRTALCGYTKRDDSDSRYASKWSLAWRCRIEQLAAESTSLHALSEKVRKPAAPSAEAAAREKKTSSFFSGPSKTSPASGAAGGSFMFMLIIVSLYVIALFP